MLLNDLLKRRESESLDFKREYSGSAKDYLHILLCLKNTHERQEKYLIFGVDDDRNIIGIEKEIESSDFNNFLAQAPLNVSFSVRIESVTINGRIVSIVVIPENLGVVYVMRTQKYGLFPNNVYTRVGCSNTGVNSTADPAIIEKILRKSTRFVSASLAGKKEKNNPRKEEDIFIRYHRAIKDSVGWERVEDDRHRDEQITTFFYKYDMDFLIKSYLHSDDFSEPWAKDAPDSHAYAYKMDLLYKKQKICEKYYVSTDGGRYIVTYPNIKSIGSQSKNPTYYYYYIRDSLDYDLNFVINNGRSLYLNRMSNIELPVFDSIEVAEKKIEDDFNSGKRLLLSYTYDVNQEYVASLYVKNYVRFPKR